jgi:hypothetical protein
MARSEEARKELEEILVLLGECLLEHDTNDRLFGFLTNIVIGRRDPFYVENEWVIKKLKDFLKEATKNQNEND